MGNISKKKAGRPFVIDGGGVVVAVHIPISHKNSLVSEAGDKGWSVAQVLRGIIAEHVIRK